MTCFRIVCALLLGSLAPAWAAKPSRNRVLSRELGTARNELARDPAAAHRRASAVMTAITEHPRQLRPHDLRGLLVRARGIVNAAERAQQQSDYRHVRSKVDENWQVNRDGWAERIEAATDIQSLGSLRAELSHEVFAPLDEVADRADFPSGAIAMHARIRQRILELTRAQIATWKPRLHAVEGLLSDYVNNKREAAGTLERLAEYRPALAVEMPSLPSYARIAAFWARIFHERLGVAGESAAGKSQWEMATNRAFRGLVGRVSRDAELDGLMHRLHRLEKQIDARH
jgi:hypothetical protein